MAPSMQRSADEGDLCPVGFAPTKARLSLYGLSDAPQAGSLLEVGWAHGRG